MSRQPLTKTGVERLRGELAQLKKVDRPRVIAAIAEARAHGDLKENAEYHAAREQQSFIEGRIQHLEYSISHAQIIDVAKLNPGEKVVFGATVTLADEETGDEIVYQIVGDVEADIKQNLIAVSSPISRAIIGREVGEVVTVRAPAGDREYEIVDVEYV
jgi:transcription elongation factor GreA